MIRVADWAQLLHEETRLLDPEEYLQWLSVLSSPTVRQPLARLVRVEGARTRQALDSLELPGEVAAVVVALAAKDPDFRTLRPVALRAIDIAREAGRGTAAHLLSATMLSESACRELIDALAQQLPRPILLDVQHDPSLVGGGQLTIGTRRIDASVRAQLRALHETIRG